MNFIKIFYGGAKMEMLAEKDKREITIYINGEEKNNLHTVQFRPLPGDSLAERVIFIYSCKTGFARLAIQTTICDIFIHVQYPPQ